LAAYVASLFDATLTWKDIEWLARVTKLPALVKGILRADDALRAVNHCASGIIVSNHGARQLDTTPAIFSVLPEIVDAVAGAVEIYIIWRDPARDRCAQSDGLWRTGGVGRARNPLGAGGRWRNRGQVCFGDAASGVRSGHGAFRLPDVELNYARSHSPIVR
jgi:hypothetical protein